MLPVFALKIYVFKKKVAFCLRGCSNQELNSIGADAIITSFIFGIIIQIFLENFVSWKNVCLFWMSAPQHSKTTDNIFFFKFSLALKNMTSLDAILVQEKGHFVLTPSKVHFPEMQWSSFYIP